MFFLERDLSYYTLPKGHTIRKDAPLNKEIKVYFFSRTLSLLYLLPGRFRGGMGVVGWGCARKIRDSLEAS